MNVAHCGTDARACFGSGGRRTGETDNTYTYYVVHKDGTYAFGVEEKETGDVWYVFV